MALDNCIAAELAWRDGVEIDDPRAAERITATSTDDVVGWIDLLRPSAADMAELSRRLNLAPTTVEDAVAPLERPKVTRHGDHLFFTVYATHLDDTDDDQVSRRLVAARISGLVLPHLLVTIRLDDQFDIAPVVARWRENSDLIAHGVGALVHGLLDEVVDGQFATIQRLDEEIEGLEDELFAERRMGRSFTQSVYRYRKDLVALRRVVLPMREVVNAIVRHRDSDGSELDHWYDDLYDHVLRAAEWTESLRDMASTVFETNLSLQDSRLNAIMKKLAAWGAIIAIPTAVTGWFGQNVPYPGFSQPLGLWMSVTLIVVLAVGLYLLFRRNDWL